MTDISQIVAPLPLQADELAEWPPLRLRVRTYLTTRLPPLDVVSSVRALVRHGNQIMVVRDPVSVHILPGGRREPGETLLQTLEREVLEETGWTIRDTGLIGLAHFQHLTPKPDSYRYPYPDFLHLVYVATADHYIGPILAAVAAFYRAHPLSVIVLCPRPEVVAARDVARAKTGYAGPSAVHAFDRVLGSETPRLGYWLDNSDLTIAETVDRILENLPQASV